MFSRSTSKKETPPSKQQARDHVKLEASHAVKERKKIGEEKVKAKPVAKVMAQHKRPNVPKKASKNEYSPAKSKWDNDDYESDNQPSAPVQKEQKKTLPK